MVASNDSDHPEPPAQTLEAVKTHILPLAPVAGSGCFIFAATEKRIPLSLALTTDTPDIRSAVIAEIKAFFHREGEPGKRLYLSRLSEAISLATGESAHKIISPTTDIDLNTTEVPVLGNITWTTYASS